MDIPPEYIARIRAVTARDKVFKEESVFSFDNPETKEGLYICMSTFLSVGKRHLDLFSKVYGGRLFLNIRRTRTKQVENRDETTKPTRLAIGVSGGFPSGSDTYTFEDDHCIVYYDGEEHKYSLDDPALPKTLVDSAKSIIEAPPCLVKLVLPDNGNIGWSGEERKESLYSKTLSQINTGRKIPPSGWKCDKCGLEKNLWLNLTDGSILCGRRYFDGTGGNNHALEHYEDTKYPLAVKLGTIGDGQTPDVFSYPEDDLVIDSNLDEHLAFWGISPKLMTKTDQTMLEMEIDINQRDHWGMSKICESDGQLQFINGKGLTPLQNIGSSCYMNAVLQVLFSIEAFQHRYFDTYEEILREKSTSPVDCLEIQISKMADGLLSGRYSDKEQYPTGIRPYMFKRVIGMDHPEFRTTKQQDAAEFFLHCMQEIKKSCLATAHHGSAKRQLDPTLCFHFILEERSEYVNSKKCAYDSCEEFALQVPMNVDCIAELAGDENKETDNSEENVPIVPLIDCIKLWGEADLINNAYVPGSDVIDKVLKQYRFKTFPDHLMLVMKRFGVNADWTPKKLQIRLDVPDIMDLNYLRASGPRDNECIIEKGYGLNMQLQAIVPELMELGFSKEVCSKALAATQSKENAIEWLLTHGQDFEHSDTVEPPAELVAQLTSMGFPRDHVKTALKNTENNVERAVDWLFSHPVQEAESPKDGNGVYELWAFISHIGRSTMSGHYVAHIKKQLESGDYSWVIFDDERVAISAKPPKEYGYIYFYRRLP